MQVQVGPCDYQVQLVRGYVPYRGEPCLGLCDHMARKILIADVLDRPQRLHVFLHEMLHAWWRHEPGRVDDEQAVADLMATAMRRLLMDVWADPSMLALFDAARGEWPRPGDPAGGKDAESADLRVRVRRLVVEPPAGEPRSPGWVVRIFDPHDAADRTAPGSCE